MVRPLDATQQKKEAIMFSTNWHSDDILNAYRQERQRDAENARTLRRERENQRARRRKPQR